MKKFFVFLCSFLFVLNVSFSQELKLKSGNPAILKEIKTFNVEYDYEHMFVGEMTEAAYIQKKIDEYTNKGLPEKGAEWKAKWISQRANFEAKFEELFNSMGMEYGAKISKDNASQYTMIVNTTHIEPGFNHVMVKDPAMLSAEIIFVETANKENVICVYSSIGNPGRDNRGKDFDAAVRIAEAYAKCAKELPAFFNKTMWK
ncbi:MAG: hypothetical protein IPO21_15185 [Bacteroidales bacterium]|nr:hypothetical protein [Bacteroidales bacterium]